MYWHPAGEYLAVKVDRYTKTKKSTYPGFELFRIKERDIPIEVSSNPSLIQYERTWFELGGWYGFPSQYRCELFCSDHLLQEVSQDQRCQASSSRIALIGPSLRDKAVLLDIGCWNSTFFSYLWDFQDWKEKDVRFCEILESHLSYSLDF
jgi:hypothetical protein